MLVLGQLCGFINQRGISGGVSGLVLANGIDIAGISYDDLAYIIGACVFV